MKLLHHHKTTEEKITDKALSRALWLSTIGILLTMTCLVGTTWAWFTAAVSSTGEDIQVASVTYTVTVKNRENVVDNTETGKDITLLPDTEYEVTLTATGTAAKSFCTVTVNGSIQYHTPDVLRNESYKFSITGVTSLRIEPNWGSAARSGDYISENRIDLTSDSVQTESSKSTAPTEENQSEDSTSIEEKQTTEGATE